MIRFTLPLVPRGQGRPCFARVGRSGVRAYTPARTRRAADDVMILAARYSPPSPIEGPIELRVIATFARPASWSAKRRAAAVFHESRPDLDNVVKLVADALTRTGRYWRDDAQIARIVAEKRYGDASGIEVEIREVGVET